MSQEGLNERRRFSATRGEGRALFLLILRAAAKIGVLFLSTYLVTWCVEKLVRVKPLLCNYWEEERQPEAPN